MYRITGDPHYREAGWSMFEAINAATAAEHGNSAIEDVTQASPVLRDEMESFWLSETLKYFYLLFMEEREFSLDEWVFNTEAHPFRRPK
jgi:mannosyl-oligosaccharide alpha-1,2-mannosidase